MKPDNRIDEKMTMPYASELTRTTNDPIRDRTNRKAER